ncbi:tyrosine-type recombinase/integrase [Amycolatopsis sp. NPDC003731]
MADVYTMRNRRTPVQQDNDLRRSRFALTTVDAAPATPTTPPRPFGDLAQATVDDLVVLAGDHVGSQAVSPRTKRRSGTRRLLAYLASFPGLTWQERWEASGLDTGSQPVTSLVERTDHGNNLVHALKAMICLRVIRPSLPAFRLHKFSEWPHVFRQVQNDPLLDKFFAFVDTMSTPERHRYRALFDVTTILATQGITMADLSSSALLFYSLECRRLGLVVNAKKDGSRLAGLLAWDALHAMGHFPPGTPPTLRSNIYKGQLTAEEMVDRYELRNAGIRQLIIDYIVRREGDSDYSTRENLVMTLASRFWSRIEQLAPDQADLRIAPELYDQWREAIRYRKDGGLLRDPEGSVLLPVRAFYLDLQGWALAEPERWAKWVAPCPIPPTDLRGFGTRRRRVNERMADRIRERQPLLPDLVEHVERTYAEVRDLLVAAREVALGEQFSHHGVTFERMNTSYDQAHHGDAHQPAVRVRNSVTGEVRSLVMEEETAFWNWAGLGVLRLTGVRAEELVELTHTSVRQYQRPNGEMIALLVIAPSKADRERVIPMSPELFHVIAAILRRHLVHGPVPVVPRYDGHERIWTQPMPYLFQRQIGGVRRVISTGTVLNNLRKQCQLLGETNPAFRDLSFTPHDFRRLFATELMNNGLPIHIGAALLGHLNLQTTRGYVAVFEEDVVRHYQDFLARRRDVRPDGEYRPTTAEEWGEFEEHFDKRKVELGSCARPYGSPCAHEHACIRCPMLHVNPKMLFRLDELETDLEHRKQQASKEGWLGEIEGLDLTLRLLREKRSEAERVTSITSPVNLGFPTVRHG